MGYGYASIDRSVLTRKLVRGVGLATAFGYHRATDSHFGFSLFCSQMNGKWGLPAFVCDVYIATDVTCSTSSILNLVAISIDR